MLTAKDLKFKKLSIAQLIGGDIFSFNGKSFFIFSSVEDIGLGLVCIHYSSTRKWQSYDRVIRQSKQVFVAPLGRHYEIITSL